MCNVLKAAKRAKLADQGRWTAREAAWEKEKKDLLDAYEKCRQGLERVEDKLQ